MNGKHEGRLSRIGLCVVLAVWLTALGLLVSQPASPQAAAPPTAMPPLGFSPAPTPIPSQNVIPSNPAAGYLLPITNLRPRDASIPRTEPVSSQPVPNTIILRFKPDTSAAERQAAIASVGGQIIQEIRPLNTVILRVPAAQSFQAGGVAAREPDYYVGALSAPNDSLAVQQWGLPAVKAPQAWDLLPSPTPTLTVAVVDSGICAAHPDLQGRIAVGGWDFVQNDGTPEDELGHGCAVAGIIAAASNNGLGIAGVAPNVSILALRVLDANGVGTYSNVAAAIVYAVDHGAQAINLSLGGPNPSSVLQDTLDYAAAHDVTVVAAAGNGGVAQVYYPAAYPSVVAVGSVGQDLQRSAFSNYGPQVDLYAPGESILSTSLDGGYSRQSGTSVAAPFVTGVWALRRAMGKTLVQDGRLVSALAEADAGAPPEPTASGPCAASSLEQAEAAYFDLVQQRATNPVAVSDSQFEAARRAYLATAAACGENLYEGKINIDAGGISPAGSELAPLYQVFGTKWADSSGAGKGEQYRRSAPPATSGGIIYYSFMSTGVSLQSKEAEAGGGDNRYVTAIRELPTNRLGSDGCNLEKRIEQAASAWNQVANIQLRPSSEVGIVNFGEGVDGQTIGNIRIGAQRIDGREGELGHAYFPPPDTELPNSTRAGDMFLDRAELWGCAPGKATMDGVTYNVIDIGLVALHEFGHALGLQHQSAADAFALMNPTYNTKLLGPNGLPDAVRTDDRQGLQAIYGAAGVVPPVLVAPTGTVQTSRVTFQWASATTPPYPYYEINVFSEDANGAPADLVVYATSATASFAPTAPLLNGKYLWRVRGYRDGAWGPWSKGNSASNAAANDTLQEFTVASSVPSLLSPEQNDVLVGRTVPFRWALGGATAGPQTLQVATEVGFPDASLILNQPVTGTDYTYTLPDDKAYFWRVGVPNGWSAPGKFVIQSAALRVDLSPNSSAAPPDGAVFDRSTGIQLSWPQVPGVTEYQLQADTSRNFVGLLFMDKLFMDKLFMDKLFMDKLFMDKLFMDKLFMDKIRLLARLFMDKLFMDKLFMDKLFMDKLFMDKLFMDKLFMDKLFMDKILAPDGDGPVTFTFALAVSDGVHYWRVRPRLSDGTYGPWSDTRTFEVRTDRQKIVINEIKLSDPSWVEFHNVGTAAVDMSGMQFYSYGPSGDTQLIYAFPPGTTLAPNAYVVLYEGEGEDKPPKQLYTHNNNINWPTQASGQTVTDSATLAGLGAVLPPGGYLPGLRQPNGVNLPPGALAGAQQPVPQSSIQTLNATAPAPERATGAADVSAQADTAQPGPTYTVNTTDMHDDGVCGTIDCTLIEAINAANANADASTINLGNSQTYTLLVATPTDAFSGLPPISTKVTLVGNNSTIARDAGATQKFRILAVAPGGDLTMDHLTITGGQTDNGGGLLINGGKLTLDYVTVTGNKADNAGGGIYSISGATLTITASTISNNTASGHGGGVYSVGTTVVNAGTIFSGNTAASNGGGIYTRTSTLTVTGTLFTANTATGMGGGLYNTGSTVTVQQTTFSNNQASDGAGAIRNQDAPGTMAISQSTMSGNSAGVRGGGIFNSATMTLINSTLVSNTSPAGGAILNNGTLNVVSSTFAGNTSASNGVSILNVDLGVTQVKNSILASSGTPNCLSNDTAPFTSVGVNFSTDASCTGFTQVTPAQLNLGALADNGGPTQTVALDTGSVAIDAINDCTDLSSAAVTTDQRGVSRPQGAKCDAGAYEVLKGDAPQPGPNFTVNTTSMTGDGICGFVECTLIEAIDAANANVDASTITLGNAQTYALNAVNNTNDGPNGLPNIITRITINGNGSAVVRGEGAPRFRFFHLPAAGNLTVNDLTLTNGSSLLGGSSGNEFYGGAVYVTGGTFQATNTIFRGNISYWTGGAILNGGTVILRNATFRDNLSQVSGGGAIANGGSLNIADSTFENNQGVLGGALYNNSSITIVRSTFTGNTASQDGGVIYTNASTVHITDSILLNNVASGSGGAIYVNTTGSVNVSGVLLTGNSADFSGAVSSAGSFTAVNSTFSGNRTHNLSPARGTVTVTDTGTVNLTFVTIADNVGNGVANTGGAMIIRNSIIASQTAANCGATPDFSGVNFSTDASCGTTNIVNAGAGLKLGPLANNGGPTLTHALLAGSPAINGVVTCTTVTGGPVTTDQRGIARPQDGQCDAGAYEFVSNPAQPGPDFRVTTLDTHDDGLCSNDDCTLVEAVNVANGRPGAHTITYDASLTQGTIRFDGQELTITGDITLQNDHLVNISGDRRNRVFTVASNGHLTLSGGYVTEGGGVLDGGGIRNLGRLDLIGVTVSSNAATGNGGGIANYGTATLTGSLILSNSAGIGGGIYNQGTLNITKSTIQGNKVTASSDGATGNGGGIANYGILSVDNSDFFANSAQKHGGAIANIGLGSARATSSVSRTTFWYNEATTGFGSAVVNTALSATSTAQMTIRNSTFSLNTVSPAGGAAANFGSAGTEILDLQFVTIASNNPTTPTSASGLRNAPGKTLRIKNSIVVQQGNGANCAGTITAQGVNFTDDATCGSGFTVTSAPLVKPLAYNNGRSYTHAMALGSPALNAVTDCTVDGSPLAVDERGIRRPQGRACDAGAFEFGGDLVVTTTQIVRDGKDGLCSLPEAIIAANTGNPSGDVLGECVPQESSPQVIALSNDTYRLTRVDNNTFGPNGLPVITGNMQIYFNEATIVRADDAPDFRIFYVSTVGQLGAYGYGTVSGGRLRGTDKGGAFYNKGVLTIGALKVLSNSVEGDGGAVANENNLYLYSSIYNDNRANRGGGVFTTGSTLTTTLATNIFENNEAGQGGAIYNDAGILDVNSGSGRNNQASASGGFLYNAGGTVTALNLTLANNQSNTGSVINSAGGSVTLTHTTISSNPTAAPGSAALVNAGGAFRLRNTIVSRNANAANTSGNCAGAFTSEASLEYPGTACNATPVNPLLGQLFQENGFLWYFPLLPGSPAIDAALPQYCPTSDGYHERPAGAGCDIGSFEGMRAIEAQMAVTTTKMVKNPDDGLCSLPEAIIAANTGAASGTAAGECVPSGQDTERITLGDTEDYVLSTVDNSDADGPNGLPVISGSIEIVGNGSTIERAFGGPDMRLLKVAASGTLRLRDVTLANGFTRAGGGAILTTLTPRLSLILQRVSIINNQASSGGGMVLLGKATIDSSAIINNTAASDDGGGIFYGDNLTISNSTIANNRAGQSGGGIVTSAGAPEGTTLTVSYSSFVGNQALVGPAIMPFGRGGGKNLPVLVSNSLFDSNTVSSNGSAQSCNVPIDDRGGNLQSDTSCFSLLPSQPLLLGPLTGNRYFVPGVGSPAIDGAAGSDCPALDQRGVTRPKGARCDVGAVETSEAPVLRYGSIGGAASLVRGSTVVDFVRFGDTTLSPVSGDDWRGANVAVPDEPGTTIGRDPSSADTNHVTDWSRQQPSEGGQNYARVLINEVYTGSNDYVELFNPLVETVDVSGWELILRGVDNAVIPASDGSTAYTLRFPPGTNIPPGGYFTVAEQNPNNLSSVIALGAGRINWADSNASGAVLLTNGLTPVDSVRFGSAQVNQLAVDPDGVVQSPCPARRSVETCIRPTPTAQATGIRSGHRAARPTTTSRRRPTTNLPLLPSLTRRPPSFRCETRATPAALRRRAMSRRPAASRSGAACGISSSPARQRVSNSRRMGRASTPCWRFSPAMPPTNWYNLAGRATSAARRTVRACRWMRLPVRHTTSCWRATSARPARTPSPSTRRTMMTSPTPKSLCPTQR